MRRMVRNCLYWRGSKKRFALLLFLTVSVNVWLVVRYGVEESTKGVAEIRPNRRAKPKEVLVSRDVTARSKTQTVEHVQGDCPHWCFGHKPNVSYVSLKSDGNNSVQYFLTAVLLVRIYDWKDLAKLSTQDLIQWFQYLSYAGVEHVYMYDAYAFKNESQRAGVQDFIASGFLTYTDWHHRAVPWSTGWTQAAAYADCLHRSGSLSAWRAGIDMDEYPFLPRDREPGFFARYLRDFEATYPGANEITELSMQNFLFLGKPLDVTKHPLLIDRIFRRTKLPANHLVKPVYRPAGIQAPDVHRSNLKYGQRITLPETDLRMNHYWGARLQNWGEDTKKVLDMTVEDRSMEPVIANLYKCRGCRPP